MTKDRVAGESLSALVDGEHTELDVFRALKSLESDPAVAETWSAYHLIRHAVRKDIGLMANDDFLSGVRAAIDDDEQLPVNESPVNQVPVNTEAKNEGVSLSSSPSNDQPALGVASTQGAAMPKRPQHRSNIWRRFAAQGAIAACFMMVFLVGANQLFLSDSNAGAEFANAEPKSEAVVPQGFELLPLTARTVSSLPSMPAYGFRQRSVGQSVPKSPEFVLSAEMRRQLDRMILRHAEQTSANGGLGVLPYSRVESIDTSGISE